VEKADNIEIKEEISAKAGELQLPVNFITVGEIDNDDVKVYIRQDIYKKIERFSCSDTAHELGSILLGDYSEALGGASVVVSEYIEAKYTNASASTLTFTHETWDFVHGEQEKLYPKLRMLGWQHTHPNYGIFLSSYDMFIQENFFNLPFQIAYVVDPIQNTRGFFQWKNGKIERLRGFYVYEDAGKPIKIEQTRQITPTRRASERSFRILLALFCVFVVAVSAVFVSLHNRMEEQQREQERLQRLMDRQAADLQALGDIAGIPSDTDDDAAADDLSKRIEAQQAELARQAELLAKLSFVPGETEDSARVALLSYTVQKGDCLAGIGASFGLDYQASSCVIMTLNGIENADSIYAGQTLLLPVPQADD